MNVLSILFHWLKDVLFPIACIGCGKEGNWYCAVCWQQSTWQAVALCPACGQATEHGKTCQNCQAVSSLNGVTAFFLYKEGVPFTQLIRLFKYNYAHDIISVWRQLLARERLAYLAQTQPLVVMPVPLYPQRERKRGFNQARILAELIAQQYGWEFVGEELQRTRATVQQARLTREGRFKNVANAFVWEGKSSPERVLLVDDVFTTGATMQECARVLKAAGTQFVWGLTLARD